MKPISAKGENMPYSIRCLKAIEALAGGRDCLAKELGLSRAAVARWVHEGKIAKGAILPLVRLSNNKFSAEELLGSLD